MGTDTILYIEVNTTIVHVIAFVPPIDKLSFMCTIAYSYMCTIGGHCLMAVVMCKCLFKPVSAHLQQVVVMSVLLVSSSVS